MNKIEELIQKLCPQGVEYVRLGEVCEVISAPKKLNKKDYLPKGLYPIIDQGQKFIIGYTNDTTALVPTDSYVIFGDHTREKKYVDFTFAQGADGVKILKSKNSIIPRFLYYSLCNVEIPNRGYNRHWTIVKDLPIPLPPLAIQEEIVNILDKFSALSAELQAELQARKLQYEYYRNQLLTCFTDEQQVTEYSLGEIGTVTRGNGLQKKDFVDTGCGCIHYGQIYTRYGTFANKTLTFVDKSLAAKLLHVKKGDLVIACTSENVEDVCKCVAWLGEEEIVTGGHACVYRHNQNPKYMAYFFQTDYFFNQKKKYAYGAKVIDIKPADIAKIRIPLPSLEEQARIVSILDKFESLVNDLSQGLPAEIAAVQEQYEYYRNKLLTFKTKE